MEIKDRMYFTSLKKINPRIHWEARKGTAQQAADYCKKEGNYIERGEISKQGARNDLKRTYDMMKRGGTIAELLEEEPNLQNIRVAKEWLSYKEEPRNFKPLVIWIWGASGTGKTRLASEILGPNTYWKNSTKWWDRYDKHENLLLDDFRGFWMQFTELLKILDRYEHNIEIKGGFRQLLAKNIIITSIVHPKNIYNIADEPINQLLRRIDAIIYKTDNNSIIEYTDNTE
jgi:adenylate kinase family enzyme